MPAPTQIQIATNSVLRLLKEELSYRKELVEQEAQLKVQEEKLAAKAGSTDADGNEEFSLRQQKLAIEQTRDVFGPLKARIAEAVERLEEQVASAPDGQQEAVVKAQSVLAQAKAAENNP